MTQNEREQELATLARQRAEMVALLNENRALRAKFEANASELQHLADKANADAETCRESAQRAIRREDDFLDMLARIDRERRELETPNA